MPDEKQTTISGTAEDRSGIIEDRQSESPTRVETTDHWSVTVERNGKNIVTIESNCLSGREISEEDERVIRRCACHLLAFIGDELP